MLHRILDNYLRSMRTFPKRFSPEVGSLSGCGSQEPVFMVKIGGVSEALMLPVIGFSTIYLRSMRTFPKRFSPEVGSLSGCGSHQR